MSQAARSIHVIGAAAQLKSSLHPPLPLTLYPPQPNSSIATSISIQQPFSPTQSRDQSYPIPLPFNLKDASEDPSRESRSPPASEVAKHATDPPQKPKAQTPAKATPAKGAAKETTKRDTAKKNVLKKDSKDSTPTKTKKAAAVFTAVEKQKGAAIPIDVSFEGDVAEAKVGLLAVSLKI